MRLKSCRCRLTLGAGLIALGCFQGAAAQDETPARQITIGNGARNAIVLEGLTRTGGRDDIESTFELTRGAGDGALAFRGTTTILTFPQVTIETPGWLALHPVIDGKPDGDMVSGFAYLDEGVNTNVLIETDHPADPGDRFLVMLHEDVNRDGVFDFVFVEDRRNVEDTAVFEGTRMIARIFEVPQR